MKKILTTIRLYIFTYLPYSKLLKNSLDPLKVTHNNEEGYFIFNTVRNITPIMHIEFFLAFSLAKFGKKCIVILDNGTLEHWDSIHDINVLGPLTPLRSGFFKRAYTRFNRLLIKKIYSHKHIEFVYLDELLFKANKLNLDISNYKAIIESCSKSSCRRFSSNLDFWSNYKDQDYYKMSYRNSLKFALVASYLIKNYKIEKLITSHGIYSCWGVMFKIFKEQGIKSLMYSELIYKPQHILISDTPHQKISSSDEWLDISSSKNLYLSPSQHRRIDTFFKNRLSYLGSDADYYFDQTKIQLPKLDLKNNGVVFGLFPNVVWDGDFEEVHGCFNSILDWVIQTVEQIKDTDNTLIIRCHPAEENFHGDSPKLEPMLREAMPDINLYKNIVIISSNFKLDIYNFIKKNIDIALIYDGMLGLEISYINKPVITVGKGRYSGSYFSEETNTKSDYLKLLKNPNELIALFIEEKKLRTARLLRFAHWYLYEKSFFLPILDANDFFGYNISNINKNDLFKEGSDYLRTINYLIDS